MNWLDSLLHAPPPGISGMEVDVAIARLVNVRLPMTHIMQVSRQRNGCR